MRVLGPVDAIAEGQVVGYPPPPGGLIGLIAVRHHGEVRVFVNSCPHLGVSLDWAQGRFLNVEGTHIICAVHGARFRLEDGLCDLGICHGDRLEQVMTQINDGMLCVPDDAGQ
jgi:nitrite reductase/ring-hydroxylating ferredoxin subunit